MHPEDKKQWRVLISITGAALGIVMGIYIFNADHRRGAEASPPATVNEWAYIAKEQWLNERDHLALIVIPGPPETTCLLYRDTINGARQLVCPSYLPSSP